MAPVPCSSVFFYEDQCIFFKVTFTLKGKSVEKWIRQVKQRFLDAAPVKCVGLGCEFTDGMPGVKQRDLPPEKMLRAALLQLSVASEVLIFQICNVDQVAEALREFLGDASIRFCGAAIGNDVSMFLYYDISIPGACDLQKDLWSPTGNRTPSLVYMSNHYIRTNLQKKKKGDLSRNEGWAGVLDIERIRYASMDACVGFEIARKYWQLAGYNSPKDHLNVV